MKLRYHKTQEAVDKMKKPTCSAPRLQNVHTKEQQSHAPEMRIA